MSQKKDSFLIRILQLFLPSDDAAAVTKRHLKAIAKEISRNKFSKWYKPSSEEFQPHLARFFFEVYKVVGPARALLASAASSKVLKAITVEQNFSKHQSQLREKLMPEAIKERAKNMNQKELTAQIKKEFDALMNGFNEKKIDEIDILYTQMQQFIHFVLFDYYFFLKKFDPALPEDKFSYTPNFSNVSAEYLKDALKDFTAVLYGLSLDTNWEKLFLTITAYKNVQPVNTSQWKKLLSLLNDVRRSQILEKIIRHITKDPTYVVEISTSTEKITGEYLKQVDTSIENTLKAILTEQKNSQVAVLARRVFGDTVPSGTKYYHQRSNAAFEKRGLQGYMYADAMNYLKSFLVDYFKSDIRALSDLLLVRGQWTQQTLSAEYSESYHMLMQISSKILEFDEKLSEVSEMGVKFRTLLSRMEREKEAGKHVQKHLHDVNETALRLIKAALKNIMTLGNAVKSCIADYDKPHRDLLQNWKEIEQHADKPVGEWMNAVYTKVYNFLVLEQAILKT